MYRKNKADVAQVVEEVFQGDGSEAGAKNFMFVVEDGGEAGVQAIDHQKQEKGEKKRQKIARGKDRPGGKDARG